MTLLICGCSHSNVIISGNSVDRIFDVMGDILDITLPHCTFYGAMIETLIKADTFIHRLRDLYT